MKKLLIAITFILSVSTSANAWTLKNFTDGMTGEVQKELHLQGFTSKTLSFPYTNPTTILAYSCKHEDFFVYTTANNLTNQTDIGDGWSEYTVRLKTDDKLQNTKLLQTWGSNWFQFDGYEYLVKKASVVLIELPIYGEGNVVFEFKTSGLDLSVC